jgi:hypothetical protein
MAYERNVPQKLKMRFKGLFKQLSSEYTPIRLTKSAT